MQHKRESEQRGGVNELLGNQDPKLLQFVLLGICSQPPQQRAVLMMLISYLQ